ncbi:YjjG family noncanonical pyrimidine nucleotidase [Formosa sp. S-31]|uniref:YjjG family noncanonical pyrimidine nucleotidase n=1 Tax=Formosa sp. S-31 TaxID=2790949 RepID=UPI003EBAF323
MNNTQITDVFFDLDHTLWDFEKNSALTFKKIFELNEIEVETDYFLKHYKPINLSYWKQYRQGEVNKEDLRYGRLNDTFKAMNLSVSDDLIYRLSEDYIQHLTSFNFLFEDTVTVLDYLQARYNLHIITNGFEEVQSSKLEGANIMHYFKTITNSEQAGVKKPHRDIFNFALKQARTEVHKSVMIGDDFEADILGAKSVGFEVIYFNVNANANAENVPQINKLIDIKNFL